MTFEQLIEKLGTQNESEWHQHANGGGWVQNTANVDASAYVGESAIVLQNARVSGNAQVSGNARVSGNAWVSGNAQVYGNAWEKSPLFIIGSRFSATNCKRGHIQIGCECHTFAWWLENGVKLARNHNFTDSEIEEYRAIVELFVKIGK